MLERTKTRAVSLRLPLDLRDRRLPHMPSERTIARVAQPQSRSDCARGTARPDGEAFPRPSGPRATRPDGDDPASTSTVGSAAA